MVVYYKGITFMKRSIFCDDDAGYEAAAGASSSVQVSPRFAAK